MLRRALKTLPPTLDATYDRILNAISDEDYTYAIRILRWLTYSRRPLTVKELATLIAIDVDSTPAFDPDQVFPDPLEVLDICSSLVSIRDTSIVARNSSGYDSVLIEGRDLSAEVVELAHYSVKEYLTSERLANLPSARYRMEAAECEAILASSCLLYLLRWERNMGRDARERVLADYPVWYWMTHMYRSDPRPEELNHLAARLLMADTPAYQEWLSTKTPLLHAIIYGLAKVVQIILERGDTIEQTAFKDALYFKRREIAFLLVEHNATLDNCLYMIRKWEDKELETAWRNKQRETVLALIKSGAESDRALSTACELDDEELAAVLIHPNLSIQLQGSELEKACVAGHAGIVRLLLQNGPEVANPIVKAQALRAAYLNKNWAIFEELLRFDAEFNSCDDDPEAYRYDSRGIHLTSIQLEEHDEEFARFLQRYSTPKSTIDRFYTKLLYRASLDGNTGLVATLVEKGVDVNVQGRAHGNALRAAIGRGHKDVVKILREAGAYAWKPGH
jgi:ankyrin repeat protein